MTKNQPIIEIKNLSKVFPGEGVTTSALEQVNLSINQGDYLSIQGPSGGGKSTLLSIIGLLDKPSSGDYTISGVEVSQLSQAQIAKVRNKEIGFIFQDFNLIGDMTVWQNVELPLIYRGVKKAERHPLVQQVLEKVNMLEHARHLPTQLSGGQQQRVAVARAIVGSPSLLLADEPTGNLDSKNGDSVMQLLAELNRDGVTICMVTHDSRYANFAKRVVQLVDGQLAESSDQSHLASVTSGTVSESVTPHSVVIATAEVS
ncbi:ABC transporter ATP-binding protein [Aliikangiella coralliicola]|uniref:ABC transporter ATP-binding protein n=1 Tax=Aliikangiella coralliicola TaxID=2592383 RepID=A0A545UBR0_9GAMM|nr:ABC transporter ATP-binding protein [Aliikangiella coralliicola]TQV86863.1 ABC transporter ATP-binding protein [Aliikangiella coralliicola]